MSFTSPDAVAAALEALAAQLRTIPDGALHKRISLSVSLQPWARLSGAAPDSLEEAHADVATIAAALGLSPGIYAGDALYGESSSEYEFGTGHAKVAVFTGARTDAELLASVRGE